MTASEAPHRVIGLDALRGIAIAMVIIDHSAALGAGTAMGAVGVDLFFVLSGYLITTLLLTERAKRGRIDLLAFWVRRACRLLPALLIVVTVVELLRVAVGGSATAAVKDWLAIVFYYSNWAWVAGNMPELMQHTWSLAVEEQFYLVWPLIVLATLARRRTLGLVVALGIAASITTRVFLDHPLQQTHLGAGTDSRGLAILAGCALALAGTRALIPSTRLAKPVLWIVLVLLAAVGATGEIPGYLLAGSLLSLPAGVVAVAASRTGGLSWSPLVWLGRRSYAVYLWHYPLLKISESVTGPAGSLSWFIGVSVVLLVTFGLAEASWRLIEAPAQAWGRAWSKNRTAQSDTGSVARE